MNNNISQRFYVRNFHEINRRNSRVDLNRNLHTEARSNVYTLRNTFLEEKDKRNKTIKYWVDCRYDYFVYN